MAFHFFSHYRPFFLDRMPDFLGDMVAFLLRLRLQTSLLLGKIQTRSRYSFHKKIMHLKYYKGIVSTKPFFHRVLSYIGYSMFRVNDITFLNYTLYYMNNLIRTQASDFVKIKNNFRQTGLGRLTNLRSTLFHNIS